MKTFLRCVREAWTASRKDNTFYYNTLLFENQTEKFRGLAASIIEEEDLKTDLEDVILKTPGNAVGYDVDDARQVFIEQGRIQ